MKVYPVRNSFNTGEVSELVEFRDDIAKYGGACLTLENGFPLVEGGVEKMPGTFYAGAGASVGARAVPFSRSTGFSDYILEFGNEYIRFWTTGAAPGLILDSTTGLPYEVATPYQQADLFDLDVDTQSADVLYIFHHLYPPMTLNHFGDADWTLTDLGATGSVDASTSESGIPKPITGVSQSNPAVVTCLDHGYSTGDTVYINHIVGMVELNYGVFTITTLSSSIVAYNPAISYAIGAVVSLGGFFVIDILGSYLYIAAPYGYPVTPAFGSPSNPISIVYESNSIDTLSVTLTSTLGSSKITIAFANATASKNTAALIQTALNALDDVTNGINYATWTVTANEAYANLPPTTGVSPVTISTMAGTNSEYYNSLQGGTLNHFPASDALFWGTFTTSSVNPANQFSLNGVNSTNYTAYDSGGIAIEVVPLFAAAGDYPSCGTLHQQRLYVGGSDNNPTKFQGSVVGDYPDFISDPEEDDYAVIFSLVSQKVDQILNMIGTPNALLMGTASGVWAVTGSNGTPITATNVNADKQTTIGAGRMSPQLVNDSALFVSNSKRLVVFLVYNFVTNQWDNTDLTRLNRDITIGTSAVTSGIAQTSFQAEPYPVFWAVRNDGQLLGLVFNKQDQVFAWFRINMIPEGGYIKSVAIISQEENEDQVFIFVERNGTLCVEYFAPHQLFGQLSNAMFLHCAVQASFSTLTKTVTGLGYLAGQTLAAVGDGSRLAVGGQPIFMVNAHGSLTFDTPALQITVGIPFKETVQPTNLVVSATGGTSRGMKQKLRRVTMSIYQGIGGEYGTDPAYMYPIPYGQSYLGGPPALFTGEVTQDIDGDWEEESKLFFTNEAPFPFTLRGFVARLEANLD